MSKVWITAPDKAVSAPHAAAVGRLPPRQATRARSPLARTGSYVLTHHESLALQRLVGNAATARVLASTRHSEQEVQVQRSLTAPLQGLGNATATNWPAITATVNEYNNAVASDGSIVRQNRLLDRIEALLRAGKALDTGFRGVLRRRSRKNERQVAQTLLSELDEERRKLAAQSEELKEWFDGLEDEIWRQHIDLRRQHFGSAVFDLGLHGKPPDPGYLESMGGAHKYLARLMGKRMTVEAYEKLQRKANKHAPPGKFGTWSRFTDKVEVDITHAGPGFIDAMDRFGAASTQEECVKILTDEGIPLTDTLEAIRLKANELAYQFAFNYPGKGEAASKARLQRLFDDFYDKVDKATPDERLGVIAAFHKQLEYMHPFNDGNTRTNLALLNKILVEYGFVPVILDNQNLSYAQTVSDWEDHLWKGMRRWQATRLALGGDVHQAMMDFDAEESTHDDLKLPPRDEAARDLEVDFRS
jgi:hypothetical protein